MQSTFIDKSLELSDWVISEFEKIQVTADGRSELAIACFYVTWQHQAAIARLCEIGLIAPARALLRCAWESWVRGMWLYEVATPKQLTSFTQGGKPPSHEELLKAIELKQGLEAGSMTSLHQLQYGTLCDFTHTGISQLVSQFSDGSMQAQLSDREIQVLLLYANTLALAGLGQTAIVGNDQDIAKRAKEKIHLVDREFSVDDEARSQTVLEVGLK